MLAESLQGKILLARFFPGLTDLPPARVTRTIRLNKIAAGARYQTVCLDPFLRIYVDAETPVEWVVIDASSISVIDITALQKFDELRFVGHQRGSQCYTLARLKINPQGMDPAAAIQ